MQRGGGRDCRIGTRGEAPPPLQPAGGERRCGLGRSALGRTQVSYGCWIEYGKGKGKRVNEVGRDKKRRV